MGARVSGREGLAGHESHEDHLAIYLYNGNEYLESMVGAFKARVAPINVNYRYVAEELQYLLDNSQARAIVYHSQFAPTLAEVLPELPRLSLLLQVRDESRNDLLEELEMTSESHERRVGRRRTVRSCLGGQVREPTAELAKDRHGAIVGYPDLGCARRDLPPIVAGHDERAVRPRRLEELVEPLGQLERNWEQQAPIARLRSSQP